jgi:hypothetical protein
MSVHPARYDDTIQRRVVYDMALQFQDENGDYMNLTGWTVASQIWDLTRTTNYCSFTVTYTNVLTGSVLLSLTDVQTTALPDKCYYDVLLTNPSGRKEYYLEGTFYVSEGYTT